MLDNFIIKVLFFSLTFYSSENIIKYNFKITKKLFVLQKIVFFFKHKFLTYTTNIIYSLPLYT